jgi:predicted DsbA family dithiol-disulfide isomerase
VEVEKLQNNWDVDVEWAPFFLDPTIPQEGRERTPQTTADSPKSHLEERGDALGIEFRRGRSFTPNSHLSLQAAEFAREHGTREQQHELHKALFKGHFTTFDNLGELDVLVRIGGEVGLDRSAMREALEAGTYVVQVDEGIAWSRSVGVTGIPTFILNDQYAVVGAQEYEVLEQVMEKLGAKRLDP